MVRYLVALVFAAFTNVAFAQEVVFHLVSAHSRSGFNNTNLGIGYCSEYDTCMGGYYNSYRKATLYVTQGLTHSSGAGFLVGLGTGYKEYSGKEVTVLGAVTYSQKFSEKLGYKVLAIPPHNGNAAVVHFALTKTVNSWFDLDL